MHQFLEELIENGESLLDNYHLGFWEDFVEDNFLDVVTKSRLFFVKLENDPLDLKTEFAAFQFDHFDADQLYEILRVLKKARNYFDKIDEEDKGVWETIHPIIKLLCKRKFDNGYYADAVETALKEINNIIKSKYKEISGIELDGAKLMQKVFSANNPVFEFADLSNETGKNIQQGYMQIFAGSMIGIRNPKAHNNLKPDKNKAIHLLQISSFLMLKIDELGIIGKEYAR